MAESVFLAFECVVDRGVLLLESNQDHYCDDCGMRLKTVGELHADTIKILRDAAHLAEVQDDLQELNMLRAQVDAYREELIKMKERVSA